MKRRELLKLLGAGAAGAALPWGCGPEGPLPEPPNILWIVWDTARSDRMSLYGHNRPTTPFLDGWAEKARVFNDCCSVAGFTVPSHASMFTGFMPSEHRCNNTENRFSKAFTSLAELLTHRNYRSYLFSANPFINKWRNFTQGFDLAEHPWDKQYREAALEIVRRKVLPEDQSCDLGEKLDGPKVSNWMIKTCGELARQGVERWLAGSGTVSGDNRQPPFFIFLNYMEAHRPYLPPKRFRRRLMTEAQVRQSYKVDRSWNTTWRYTFGRHDYSPEELELTRLTYDAALAELDELLDQLLTGLQAGGHLDNTVVILSSDHGEHLGEQHMMDHQYTVYEPVLRVPLLIHYPQRLTPGRDPRPVSNIDLFPTILELAGIDRPAYVPDHAVSLLSPAAERVRVAECPSFPPHPFETMKETCSDFDPQPWSRTLQAVYDREFKYIPASDGRHELYDLAADPAESRNLVRAAPQTVRRMAEIHRDWTDGLQVIGREELIELDEDEIRRLQALGYLGPGGS